MGRSDNRLDRRPRSRSPEQRSRDRRGRSRSKSPRNDRRKHKKRSRSRSRSRSGSPRRKSRKKEDDRNSDRNRRNGSERDQDRHRDRDRDRDRRRDKHSTSSSKSHSSSKSEGVLSSVIDMKIDKDKEQEKLELEMQKRRERIEKWRAEKKKKEIDSFKADMKQDALMHAKKEIQGKAWSLEDDADEEADDGTNGETNEDTEEEDPLDAFMNEIKKEVTKGKSNFRMPPKKTGIIVGVKKTATKIASASVKSNSLDEAAPKKSMIVMSGVAKKKDQNVAKRGELIEQNQDGLEYSSEEEKEETPEEAMNRLAKKGKKDLALVDHNKIEYLDFKKDFYVEVPEIKNMTDAEVEAYREEMESIKVKGKNCPRPIKTWPQCGVTSKIFEVLKVNFEKPTPIQAQAIPVIMSGRDMMGIAKTGSGKTLAFLLPLFRHINAQPDLEEGDGPIAIIMTPTRELCMQIGKEIKRFQKGKIHTMSRITALILIADPKKNDIDTYILSISTILAHCS